MLRTVFLRFGNTYSAQCVIYRTYFLQKAILLNKHCPFMKRCEFFKVHVWRMYFHEIWMPFLFISNAVCFSGFYVL
jgi:hypothetical protein